MARPKAVVLNGLGIGCHEETAHAYEKAGAEAEVVHIGRLFSGELDLSEVQILNPAGGFLQGDKLGSGMCAASELEYAVSQTDESVKERLLKFAEKGVIYGQCNGFQFLVKTGLLPGIDGDYSKQVVTLTHNECGNYRVSPVFHKVVSDHFAFEGVDSDNFWLWCRHAEGNLKFHSEHGSISKEDAEATRDIVNRDYVTLRYADPVTGEPNEEFPHNPNGSIDAIAGLANQTGNIFANMAHPEVSVYASRDPRWFDWKDDLRRNGMKAEQLDKFLNEGAGARIFENIVGYFR